MVELRRLTEHCDYGVTLPAMLRDRLVCGIAHERIQQKLLSEGEGLTLEKAINIALSMESAIAQANEIQGVQQKSSSAEIQNLSTGARRNDRPSTQECYRCGGNHLPDLCQFKDKECFFCRNRGHAVRKCKKKARAMNQQQRGGRKVNQLTQDPEPGETQPDQHPTDQHPSRTTLHILTCTR